MNPSQKQNRRPVRVFADASVRAESRNTDGNVPDIDRINGIMEQIVGCKVRRCDALGVADRERGAETGAFGYEHCFACLCGGAAAALHLEHNPPLHDAYPLVVVQSKPRLRRGS